ncbi:MAG: SDR family oxidoreductase [Saprospiraceae bacterium]|nr:SDR family oxidoreductase [Saprospiraceae bacterium]
MRNALVTGASKGIGKAIAEELCLNGFEVHICARNEEDLQIAKQEILERVENAKLFTYKVDLSNITERKDFAQQLLQKLPKLDVLINNAGTFVIGSTIDEPDGTLEHLMNTNLYSAYYITKYLIPLIKKSDSAHIINMCSIASKVAYPNGGSYSISKFALYGFTKVLREELKDKNIKVTAILPGATWSDSWKGVDLPQERLMSANDIAKVIINCISLSKSAVIEEIILRPQLGDL